MERETHIYTHTHSEVMEKHIYTHTNRGDRERNTYISRSCRKYLYEFGGAQK